MNNTQNLLLCVLIITPQITFAQYPLAPQAQQHYINGTVGEERGGRNRYHYGLDMAAQDGTPVYSIEAGTIRRFGAGVAIGHYAYVHVVNCPYNNGDVVQANELIGYIQNGQRHVHLQQSTSDLSAITGFEEQDGTPWINPISHLNPIDNVIPEIDGTGLYRQGNNNGNHITNDLTLFGQIDVKVDVEDARINANDTSNGFGVAPYTINYEVLDLINTVMQTYPGLSFANVLPNASATTVHGPNANWGTPNFEYWITNDAFNIPYDKYWNTLQQQGGEYNASAACPEQTLLPEGQRVRLRVNACDYSNNCDQVLLPNRNATDNYVIDNFKPYLKKVTIKYGNETVYEAAWDCVTACANGLLFKKMANEKMLINDVPDGFTIIAEASEALSQLDLSIPSLGLNNLSASDVSPDQRTFTFTTGAITPNQFQYAADRALSFSGQDNNGNVLMALQTFKNAACTTIPTRTGNTTWANPSNVPFNIDLTHILPVCPEISFQSNVILNNPVGCNTNDGSIRVLSTNNIQPQEVFPNYNYTTRWEDELGNILVLSGPSIINLGPGKYCHILTDPHGCTGEDCKKLTAEHYPDVSEAISPACVGGGNVGSVEVIAHNIAGGTYTFDWSTGHRTAFNDHSTITNLAPGTYSVTISSDIGSCTVVKTFTVPTIQPQAPLVVSFTTFQPCPEQNNGQINLTVSGGIPPYSYAWSDSPQGVADIRTQLMAGNYTSTITDYCGAQVVTSIPLTPMTVSSFTLTPGCENQGTGNIQIVNGNPGYSYAWNTNPPQSSANTQNLRNGTICVTVTDNRGCVLTQCNDLLNKQYRIIEENLPCEGFNDGSLKLKVYNPLAELVQINLDGQPMPILNPFATEVTQQVPNLASDANYSLAVTIGTCSYTYPFTMQHKPVNYVYDRYNNNICYYDVYCGPNLIANDGHQSPPRMNFNGTDGGWLTKCYVPTVCGDTEVNKVQYTKRTDKALVYYLVLYDALANSPHSSDYVNARIGEYNRKGLKSCDFVRWCPASLKIIGTIPGTNGTYSGSGDCYKLDCKWPVKDEDFCLFNKVPDYFFSSINPIIPNPPAQYNCQPRVYSLYELISWKGDLLAKFPNTFPGTELYNLISYWELVEPVDQRIYCATVGFCLTDFKVLFDNIWTIDCSSCESSDYVYYGPDEEPPLPCSPEEGSSLTKVYCKNYSFCSGGGGCCLFPVFLRNNFPGEFLIAPSDDALPPFHTYQQLPHRTDEFVNFGEAHADSTFIPKGLFKNKQGNGLYYDYFPHTTSAERETIPNIKLSVEDFDENILAYISKNDNEPIYYLGYEDDLRDWTVPIVSSGFLEISHLSREDTLLIVACQYQGTLTFGSLQIANSTSTGAIILRISNTGTVVTTRKVENFDTNQPLTFERSGSNLMISGRTGTTALGTNGQTAIQGSQPGQYFTLQDHVSDATYQYQSNLLNVSSGMTLLKTTYSKLTGNRTYLFAGSGTVQINSQTIAQPSSNQLTLVTLTPVGALVWVNTVNVASYYPTELDLTEGDNGSMFLGLTFIDTLTASNQTAVSNGGKDVAILKYGINGLLTGIKSFGSLDDEEVKRCIFTGGNLYFGGNYRGLTFERLIGNNIYESYPSDSVYCKAYITYLPDSTFGTSMSHRPVADEARIKPVVFTADVYVRPNPFTDKIQVWLKSNIMAEHTVQLVNALGVTVWIRKVAVTEGENVLTINDLEPLPVGIYALRVLVPDGQIYTYKMLKQ